MTEVITIDLATMCFALVLPFWIASSISIALALGKRFEVYIVGEYVEEIVRENNKLVLENRRMKKDLKNKKKSFDELIELYEVEDNYL